MNKTQKNGGTKTTIEAGGLTCLDSVRTNSDNNLPLSEERVESLTPLVKRALEIAADSVESWLADAVSVDDSGITISYHLVWSDIPDDVNVSKDYVTEEEFREICKQVAKAVQEPL